MIPPLMREILVNISLIRGEMMGLTDTKYSLRSKKGHHLDKIFLQNTARVSSDGAFYMHKKRKRTQHAKLKFKKKKDMAEGGDKDT